MVVSRLVLASPTDELSGRLSDEVELYQRTYNTLLRSSGETHLRVLEPAHRAMGSSLHPLADSDEPDLGAFIYAIRRMPDTVADRAQLVILGQEKEAFARNGIEIDECRATSATRGRGATARKDVSPSISTSPKPFTAKSRYRVAWPADSSV